MGSMKSKVTMELTSARFLERALVPDSICQAQACGNERVAPHVNGAGIVERGEQAEVELEGDPGPEVAGLTWFCIAAHMSSIAVCSSRCQGRQRLRPIRIRY